MSKEKRTLHKEIYVRIYDKKIVEKYEEVKKSKREDVSDNEFVQELIKLGLKVLSPSREDSADLQDRLNEIDRKINVLIKAQRTELREKEISNEITNKRANAVYNIVVAQATGESITEKEIEAGMYDVLPDRFSELYEKGEDES